MIFTDRKITIRNGKSSINEPVILYRGDFEVSIRFTIMESKFRFKSGVNLVDSEKASFGQLAILAPYGGNVFSEIVKCEDGTVTFTLTKEMIDQLEEVGLYSFQIRLFDYYRESRVSIPPVEFGIEVREPVASEDHDNEVNNAIVGYSIAKVVDPSKEDVGSTFDDEGNYNKTNWETGDRISEGKLNKIEDALDKINQNEKNDKNALNKQITSNFNVMQNQIDNLVLESGGDSSLEVVQARGEYSLLNQRLNAMDETDANLALQLEGVNSQLEQKTNDIVKKINEDTSKLYELLNVTYNVNIVWQEGYYRIDVNNTKKDLSAAAGKSKISKPIKLNAGDYVKIKTKDYAASYIMVLTDENESFYKGVISGTFNLDEFEYTVSLDTYMIFGTSAASVDSFEIQVIPSKSKELVNIKDKLKNIESPNYSGVLNPGTLTTVTDTRKDKTTTLELVFSINTTNPLKWFYGSASTNMLALYHSGTAIRASLNVGNYETSEIEYNVNDICHVVLTFNNEERSKCVYFNGEFANKKTNSVMASQTFKDALNVSGNVTIYQKRVWDRALSDAEVKSLYNYGFPTKSVISDSLKEGLISELTNVNLEDANWLDSATNTIIELNTDKVLIEEDEQNVYKCVSDIQEHISKNEGIFDEVIYPDFKIEWTNRGAHDCTFIDDKLVSFNKPSDGNTCILNSETLKKEKNIKINFIEENSRELEMKSIDYKFDKLIVGNGRAIKYDETSYEEQGAKLYIFHDAKNWLDLDTTTEINFDTCGIYDTIDISQLGYKVYGFWGSYEDCVFVSCNLFNDIYLIQLGKGIDEFENGVMSANTDSERYNGTFKILNHWQMNGELDPNSAHGGQFYKGNLYIAPNTLDDCKVYKYSLLNNGKIKLDILNFEIKNSSNKPKYHYIDGLCIKDNILYAQPLCCDGSYSTVYNTLIVANI